jgi:AraC family transcriptional regulator, regulatory protein of adaptative response / DNA-3-methyladenine glycosylase II
MLPDADVCYRAVQAKDPRFDGWFYTAVRTTGVYCRPSCPARTPKRENVRFHSTGAAAAAAGFRACRRCRPDAAPGSPEWNLRADVVGRAMRLIADGVVDRDGVSGLARRLGFSERHLHRQLVAEVGVGPLALARAQRVRTARTLLETTELPISEVAFAAGFASVRQFNATIQEALALTPTDVRRRSRRETPAHPDTLTLRLPFRAPLDAAGLFEFLGRRAVTGVEEGAEGAYRRSLRLPHGAGIVELRVPDGHVRCRLWLADMRDLAPAVQRCRRLLDLDADPVAIAELLGDAPLVGALVRRAPGRRVAGHVDGAELAVRALLGQQVSLPAATKLAARLVAVHGEKLPRPVGGVTHLFPSPDTIAGADARALAMPVARRMAVRGLASVLASGELELDAGVDRAETRRRLLAVPGVGPWTASYVAMRALGDPDAFPAADLGVRHAVAALGHDDRPAAIERLAEGWRPFRAYAAQHLWSALERPGRVVPTLSGG